MFKKLMYVKWKDHWGPSHTKWITYDNKFEPEPMTVESVGWVLYDNKDILTLVPHKYYQDDDAGAGQGEINILKSCIVSKKVLQLKPKKKT